MIAKDVMTTNLCIVDPETMLGTATTLMGERHIGSVLVCEGDRLVGIVTERDVVRAISHAYDAPNRPVAEWMTRNPTTAPADVDAKDALQIMIDGGFRHLPIVNDDKPVGMISMRDLARLLSQ